MVDARHRPLVSCSAFTSVEHKAKPSGGFRFEFDVGDVTFLSTAGRLCRPIGQIRCHGEHQWHHVALEPKVSVDYLGRNSVGFVITAFHPPAMSEGQVPKERVTP